jgi:hypothetical protein
MKWESDICEVKGSKVIQLGTKEGLCKSSIHVVGDISYMDTTMVEIIFLIFEGRYNLQLILRKVGVDLKQEAITRWNMDYK